MSEFWLDSCSNIGMILVITPSAKVQEAIPIFVEATSEPVHVAPTLRQAAVLLRAQDYSAVVLDQVFLDAEPDETEVLMQHTGTAVPVYVNFGISGTQRVISELRSALQRRKRELASAKDAAERAFRNELSGSVTAMLLSCEMALQVPELPGAAEAKLKAVYELAQELRGKVGVTE